MTLLPADVAPQTLVKRLPLSHTGSESRQPVTPECSLCFWPLPWDAWTLGDQHTQRTHAHAHHALGSWCQNPPLTCRRMTNMQAGRTWLCAGITHPHIAKRVHG
jgi:hypothetical protein